MTSSSENASDTSDNYDSDGEDDAPANESCNNFIRRRNLRLSSWAFIYESVINLLQYGEHIEIDTILDSGKQAASNDDPVSALKFFSLGLTKILEQNHRTERQKASKNGDSNTFSSPKEIMKSICQAFDHCSQSATRSTSFRKQHGKVLRETLYKIIVYYDMLAIMDVDLLSNAAAMSFSLKDHQKALQLASRARKLNPSSMSAQEVYENICCHLVERWHFVMLNDKTRNNSYKTALQSVLVTFTDGATVCDVGCGTGLLSLIAAQQANCNRVFAIEKSSVMCDVARDVLRANLDLETAAKVKFINKMSSKMSVPEDLPNRTDILVTETFDAGLFGEGILPTLCHAWTQLLKNENSDKRGIVIPSKAQLYIQAVECDYIRNESRLHSQVCHLELGNIHICTVVGMCESEPYTTQDLKNIPGGFMPLSEPVRFMAVDFNDPEKLSELNRGVTQEISISISKTGRLDALIMWFQLHLTETVDISTHIDCNSCWEQAVFPVCPWKLKDRVPAADLFVNTSSILHIAQLVKGAKLCMTVTDITEKEINPQQFDKITPVMTNSYVEKFYRDPFDWCTEGIYCLNGWEVSSLNDKGYLSAVCERLNDLSLVFEHGDSQSYFLHLNNGFSPICLKALQLGYSHAFTLVYNPTQEILLERLCQQNKLNSSKLTTLEDVSGFLELISEIRETETKANSGMSDSVISSRENNGDTFPAENISSTEPVRAKSRNLFEELPAHSYAPEMWATLPTVARKPEVVNTSKNANSMHAQSTLPLNEGVCSASKDEFVVFCDVVDFQGRLVENLSDHLAVIKYCLSKFESKTVIPYSFDIYGALVDSNALSELSCVQSDEHTLGYTIGNFLNEFSTRNHQGIILDTLPHSKLTKPFKIFSVNLSSLVGSSDSVCHLDANQVMCSDGVAVDEQNLSTQENIKLKTGKKRQLNREDGLPGTTDASLLDTDETNTAIKKYKNSVPISLEIECNTRFPGSLQSPETSSIVTNSKPEVPLKFNQSAHPTCSGNSEYCNLDETDNAPIPVAVSPCDQVKTSHSYPLQDSASSTTSNSCSLKSPLSHYPTAFSDAEKITSVFQPSSQCDQVQSASETDSGLFFTSESSSYNIYSNLPSNSGGTVYADSSTTSKSNSLKNTLISCKSVSSSMSSNSASLMKEGEHCHQQASPPFKKYLTALAGNEKYSNVRQSPSAVLEQKQLSVWTQQEECEIFGNAKQANMLQSKDSKTGGPSQKEQLAAGDGYKSHCQRNEAKTVQTAVGSQEPDWANENLEVDKQTMLDQIKHVKVPIIQSGNVTALVYWFDLHVSPTTSINTLDPTHHWQQAAVMTHMSKHVTQGDVLNLQCGLSNSAISFTFKESF